MEIFIEILPVKYQRVRLKWKKRKKNYCKVGKPVKKRKILFVPASDSEKIVDEEGGSGGGKHILRGRKKVWFR